MAIEDLALLSRRARWHIVVLVAALVIAAIWGTAHLLQPAPPRRIVLASGLEDGLYHRHAQRYIDILAVQA
jgi:hypothetical protein